MKKLFFVSVYLLLAVPCAADIIIVDDDWPYDFNNIQAAIDDSNDGDFIIVFPGRYTGPGNYNIDFKGKAVTVQSVAPTDPYIVGETIIDCNGLGRGFNFTSDEDANSVLAGLTIINGFESYGGAIYCKNSSPTITYCNITGSSASEGAAIFCSGGSPSITNCSITGNSAEDDGGGIYCQDYSGPTIAGCIISGNSASNGGGIYFSYDSYGSRVISCTITGNSADDYGGGIYTYGSVSIYDCIIWGNEDTSGTGQSAQVYEKDLAQNVWFSCIQDDNPNDANIPFGQDSYNIDDDPCFVDAGFRDTNGLWHEGDYHLLNASPCIDTGNPYHTYHTGDVDMDGQPRLMGYCVDMGADEFEAAMVVVTKPQAGAVWAAGSTHEINWGSNNITGTVDIYYSVNNGADWVMIDNVANTGSFTWHLPGAVDSNQCLISVEPNVPVSNLICNPSGLFTIHPDSPGPPVASKWKSLGGDFNRAGLSENFGPELGCIEWQFQTDGPVSASPSVGAFGRIHLSCEDGKLYTLDANGQLLWSYDTNSPLLSSPSIGPDGSAFVGAENGTLFAIDVNGTLRWTHSTDGFIYSSPAISADGNIFVCSQDGTLYALAQDGTELWTFKTDGPDITAGAIFASPTIGPDGTLFISGLYDPNLYAIDPNTGSVKWTCTFLDPCEPNCYQLQPFASPIVAPDGTIYQALLFNPLRFINKGLGDTSFWYDSRLYAIDSNNGNILWSTNMTETAKQKEQESPPEPNYWFKQYYFGLYYGDFSYTYPYTFTDLFISDILRYYRVSNASWSEPALAPDGTIYVSFDDQYLRAVDPNGSIKWVTSLGWGGGFKLTIGSDGLIYAACSDGWLYVVDPNGKEIARLESGTWLGYPVIYDEGIIIIADSNNTVSAVSSDGCEGKSAVLHRLEDLNSDWLVNFVDFAVVADIWLECTDTSFDPVAGAPYCYDDDNEIFLLGDINRDQYIDSADLADLTNQWLIEE